MKIKNIKKIPRNKEPVYNLEVKDNHNYLGNDILVSNCHGSCKKHSEVYKMIKVFPTFHKYGFTGTLPSCKYDTWTLMGVFGRILLSKEITELQEKGYISNIKILPIRLKHTSKKMFPRETYEDICNLHRYEYQHIEECVDVVDIILRITRKLTGNSFILFDHIVAGQLLMERANEILFDKKLFYIDGSVDLNTREDMRTTMEKQSNVVCIGNTKCISTGINVKNIQNIVFTGMGYSTTKIIQSLGRSLRLHPEKKNAVLLDFFHNYTYSTRHFDKRMLLYKKYYSPESLQKIKTIILP